jgi:hypothetical protein
VRVSSAPILSVTDLTTYVAALPESAAKATLRGFVVAARMLQGDDVDQQLLTRMRRVVSEHLKNDPLRALEQALSRCQAVESGPESESP